MDPGQSEWDAGADDPSGRAAVFAPARGSFRKEASKAPSAHRALPGPRVYRFGFSRKADALTRKRKATQCAAFPPNLATALMSLPSVALSSVASKSIFMVTLSTLPVNIQRCGGSAQSPRQRRSIPAESMLNLAGFGALARRYTHPKNPYCRIWRWNVLPALFLLLYFRVLLFLAAGQRIEDEILGR